MFEFLSQAFVTLLVIVDPFAVVHVFLALTPKETTLQRNKIALKASVISCLILFSFAFLGDWLLDVLGISEPAFRITGGFLLLLAAIEMVVAKNSGGIRSTNDDESAEAAIKDDITVFPLSIPLMSGPGAMPSVVVLMRQAEQISFMASLGVVLIILVVILITYMCLRSSSAMMKVLGVTGTNVLTRVFGIILAALAMQSILTGIQLFYGSLCTPPHF